MTDVVETLTHDLDIIIERILTKCDAADGMDKGRAESLAYAIAVLKNPHKPDTPAVAKESVLRIRRQMEE